MYIFTYLRPFTFTLESIQSEIAVTMQKAKIKQSPPLKHALLEYVTIFIESYAR